MLLNENPISECPSCTNWYEALQCDCDSDELGVTAPTCSPVKFWMKVRLVELIITT